MHWAPFWVLPGQRSIPGADSPLLAGWALSFAEQPWELGWERAEGQEVHFCVCLGKMTKPTVSCRCTRWVGCVSMCPCPLPH